MVLFTFVTMGATLDRVVVLTIVEADEPLPSSDTDHEALVDKQRSVALRRFQSFDVRKASCFHVHERAHLLGVTAGGNCRLSRTLLDDTAPARLASIGLRPFVGTPERSLSNCEACPGPSSPSQAALNP